MKAPTLLALTVLSISTAQAAEGVLALACEGTVETTYKTQPSDKPEPISMGIIVDFTARTVTGFTGDFPVVAAVNEVAVTFGGFNRTGAFTISGSIDRVTGNVEVFSSVAGSSTRHFSLHCEPKQRTLNAQ
jgi:hypothetical protein